MLSNCSHVGLRFNDPFGPMSGFHRGLSVLFMLLITTMGSVHAQEIDVGGRAYVDYFYNISAPDFTDQLHGFRYRRLYLTTDFTLSDDFEGRARLEANDGTVGPNGPEPYVKDLSLTWTYSGSHSATLGITPPPAFGAAEDVWGYRSLDKTILDLQGIVSSRDFGLRLDGPIVDDGTVRYAVMVANDSGVRPETDTYKRVYAQIEMIPTERLTFVVGSDYAGGSGPHGDGVRVSAFGGYTSDAFRIGLEAYWYRIGTRWEGGPRDLGASLFGSLEVGPKWELVARLDRSREAGVAPVWYDTFFVGGLAYRPHPNVALIPNVRVRDRTDATAETTGRFTVEVDF